VETVAIHCETAAIGFGWKDASKPREPYLQKYRKVAGNTSQREGIVEQPTPGMQQFSEADQARAIRARAQDI
jgi:hypothetical protein